MKKILLPVILLSAFTAGAQVSIVGSGVPVSEDFTGFDGTGFDPAPAAGQLNSNNWEVLGFSDGDLLFGGSAATGDLARGITTGNITSGGLYAFDNSGNTAVYIQPTSSDFNPGSITWKLQNNTGSILTEVDLAYTVYIYNNEGRANNWNCSYSYDNTTFVNIPSLDLVSVEADEDLLYTYNQSTSIPGLSIGDGDFFYIRWDGADVSGSGSRDEFGLDDISLTAYAGEVTPLAELVEDVSVVEGAGAATVSVELNVSANCDVYVSATDGTAEMFVDYLFDPAVISFTEGGATIQTFDVLIGNDFDLEFTETLTVHIDSTSEGCATGLNNEVTVSIIDDETAATGPCENLFFSEYIEGSSNNKALEIYNPGAVDIDMDGYVVKVFNNGSTVPSNTFYLTGMIASEDVYLIVNASADSALLSLADTTASVTFFNGNDAVVLFQFMDTLDMIGVVGEDPITEWPVDTGGTGENTLVRKASVSAGQTDWSIGATEWDVYAQNTFDFYGTHTADGCAPACTTPDDITVEPDAGGTTALVSWTAVDGGTQYGVRYREIGSPMWLKKATTGSMTMLTGLTPGADYEFQMVTRCGEDRAGPTSLMFFSTPARTGIFTEGVSVFPNPSSGTFYMNGFDNETEELQIHVYDLSGRLLYLRTDMHAGELVAIDLPDALTGQMILEAIKGDQMIRSMIIVE